MTNLPQPITFLTISDVAAELGVSRSTVHAWIDCGALRARVYRTGAIRPTIRISREAVQAFLATHADDGDGSAIRDRT